jgi:hypothetical protein
MSTLPDIAPAEPVSIEEAEEASDHLGEQVERVRQVVSNYRADTGAPPFDDDSL